MTTLKEEVNFVLKFISFSYGGWQGDTCIESRLDVAMAMKRNMVLYFE